MEKKERKKPSYLPENFLDALRQAVQRRGGQAVVAYEARVSQPQICRILQGRDAYVSTLMRLLSALDGGIGSVDGKSLPMVSEAPAEFMKELMQTKIELADMAKEKYELSTKNVELSREMEKQQEKILKAIVNVCEQHGITGALAHDLQAAVSNYEAYSEGSQKVGFMSAVDQRHAVSE